MEFNRSEFVLYDGGTLAVTPRHRSDLTNATDTALVILTLCVEENGEIQYTKYFHSHLTAVQVSFKFTYYDQVCKRKT